MNKRALSTFGNLLLLVTLISLIVMTGQGIAAVPGGTPNYFGPDPNYANSPAPTVAGGVVTPATGIRKFVDTLPGLGAAIPGGIGLNTKYIPVATADTGAFPGSDYYEIAVVEYQEQLHSDLPPTRLRGYVQLSTTSIPGKHIALTYPATGAPVLLPNGTQAFAVDNPQYLGPIVVAQQNRAVRVKFVNLLPTGAGGNLFIPVDTSIMGAGLSPYTATGASCDPTMSGTPGNPVCVPYTQNRATLHLHGGNTPWISDGTPHQWIVPAGETSVPAVLRKGVSAQYVPDMWFNAAGNPIASCAGQTTCTVAGATNNPGPGALTFYYTNQQSARLMFYHDHAYGITRLNVYAGEAAGYLVQDPTEQALVTSGVIPATQIPLIIQDKTIVDASTIPAQDPTWNWGTTPGTAKTGDLWFPHVYMPNQWPDNPDLSGANNFGRWDYGPWFWPPLLPSQLNHGPDFTSPGCNTASGCPGTPNPSLTPEAYMDTPIINGAAYPTITVQPQAYRMRALAAGNDRMFNLQLYVADPAVTTPDGRTNTEVKMVPAVPHQVCQAAPVVGTGTNGCPTGVTCPAVTSNCVCSATFAPAGCFVDTTVAALPACAPGVTVGIPNYVTTLAAGVTVTNPATGCWPSTWPTDARDGGVPDPTTAGPSFIVIGTEGGLLPTPAVVDNAPVGYEYNRRNIVVLNVSQKALWLGPAERADVIVDFSQYAGKTLILYNDAPAPVPAFDPRNDYYTGDPDQSVTGLNIGGAPTTVAGFGPNTRTVMQIVVAAGTGTPFNLAALQTALPTAFAASQPALVVPAGKYAKIQDTAMAFTPTVPTPLSVASVTIGGRGAGCTSAPTITFTGGGGSGANATAFVSGGAIVDVQINDGGTGYTTAPAVSFAGGGCTTAPTATSALGYPLLPKAIQELFELNYGRMNATLGTELPLTNFNTQTTIPLGYIDPPTEIIQDGDTQLWKITHNGVDTHAIHFHLFDVQLVNRVGWDGMIKPPLPMEAGWKDTVIMNPLEDAIVAFRAKSQVLPFKLPDSVRPLDVTMPLGSTGQFTGIDPKTNNPITVTNVMTNFGWEYVWHCHLLGHEENDMMRPMAFQVAPAAPSNLTAAVTASVRLNWTNNETIQTGFTFTIQRATNAAFTTGLTTYAVTAPTTTFLDTAVTEGSTYYYRVRAENAKAYSSWSNTATITVHTVHVGALSGARNRQSANWTATVTITAVNGSNARVAGVLVAGGWAGGTGGTTSCTTNLFGTCQVTRNVASRFGTTTFTVNNMTRAGYVYQPTKNVATSVTVR